jgi:hypothetical protein
VARAAAALRTSLAADERLWVAEDVLVPAPMTVPAPEQAGALVRAARTSYANLQPHDAMAKLAMAREHLRTLLDAPGAALELAAALRVEGLTLLFLEKPDQAAERFVSAHFLAPAFSPDAGAWPPEARLAYADAVAAARREESGSLSVRVQPESARVWLDGREVGLGATTVRDLTRGTHHLLVTCPGYTPFAAAVSVEGGGHLDEASVFLESRPRAETATALADAFAGPSETAVARQVAAVLGVDALVVVMDDAGARQTVVWVLDAEGARLGSAIPLLADAAAEVATRIAGPRQPGVVAEATPWYLRWYTLVGAGVVLVGGAVALGVALNQDTEDRVSFHLGPAP